jgi:hypothetical protein
MGRVERKRVLRRPAKARRGENAAKAEEEAVRALGANTERNTGTGRGRVANLCPPWPKGVSGNPGGRPRKQPITCGGNLIMSELFEENG